MKYFTPKEELSPSEMTLNIIRQIAYSYRTINDGKNVSTLCMN